MIDLKETVAPTANLVTLKEVEDYLNLTDSYPELTLLIRAVQDKAEAFCARSFTSRTYELRVDKLSDIGTDAGVVELPRYPVTSITSIATLDETGASTTVSSSDYYLTDQRRVVFTTVPTLERDYGGLLITYVSGDSSQVPDSIKVGMLKALSTVFENRENYIIGATLTKLPDNSKVFFNTWRDLW